MIVKTISNFITRKDRAKQNIFVILWIVFAFADKL